MNLKNKKCRNKFKKWNSRYRITRKYEKIYGRMNNMKRLMTYKQSVPYCNKRLPRSIARLNNSR